LSYTDLILRSGYWCQNFLRVHGEQLRHSAQLRHAAIITSTTSVAKVGCADFTVTFLQPDLRYHIRVASTAERDIWVRMLVYCINMCRRDKPEEYERIHLGWIEVYPDLDTACCATGVAMSCTHSKGALGRCLIAGEVARWFRLAALPGYPDAQFNLGLMFENGQGVVRDKAEAVRWYRNAAAQGHAVAAAALGRFGASLF
jgi:hypothetical protein